MTRTVTLVGKTFRWTVSGVGMAQPINETGLLRA